MSLDESLWARQRKVEMRCNMDMEKPVLVERDTWMTWKNGALHYTEIEQELPVTCQLPMSD